jgi:hypothetical protein
MTPWLYGTALLVTLIAAAWLRARRRSEAAAPLLLFGGSVLLLAGVVEAWWARSSGWATALGDVEALECSLAQAILQAEDAGALSHLLRAAAFALPALLVGSALLLASRLRGAPLRRVELAAIGTAAVVIACTALPWFPTSASRQRQIGIACTARARATAREARPYCYGLKRYLQDGGEVESDVRTGARVCTEPHVIEAERFASSEALRRLRPDPLDYALPGTIASDGRPPPSVPPPPWADAQDAPQQLRPLERVQALLASPLLLDPAQRRRVERARDRIQRAVAEP